DAIESRYVDQPGLHVELLALHAFHGEQWERALHYLRQAGAKAAARSAYIEAAAHFRQAQVAMRHLPATREILEQTVAPALELRNALFTAGELPQMEEPLRTAETAAEQLGDDVRRGQVLAILTNSRWAVGEYGNAVEAGFRTLAIAEKLDERALRAV